VTTLSKLDKFLVKKFGSTKYEKIEDVPDQMSGKKVLYARDKGRAHATFYLILFSFFSSVFVIYFGKWLNEQGHQNFQQKIEAKNDDLMAEARRSFK
jgi:hypothetical protein